MDRARELYRRSVFAIKPKKFSSALGISLGHAYRLTRDPMDMENPEGTGAERTDFDRLDLMFDLLAADVDNRPLLIEWELLIREGFDRRIRHLRPRSVSHADVVQAAAKCAREHGEMLAEALTEGEDERALHEATEALACMEELVAALSARVDAASVRPIAGRRSA